MSDYIKREDALRAFNGSCSTVDADDILRHLHKSIDVIKNIPPADVRENVRGEWLPHPINGNREWDVCSACGIGCKRREYGIHANGEKWVTEYNFPFCPNCGADMRGENNV